MQSWRENVARDLESYLKELQTAMTAAGADPALIQDALFDAEEYLRTEMTEHSIERSVSAEDASTAFAAATEGYGSPEEVAAEYVARAAGEADQRAQGTVSVAGVEPREPEPVAGAGATGAVGAAGPRGTAGAGGAAETTSEQVVQGPSVLRQVFGVVVDPAVYKALLYMLLSLGTGIAYFTFVVTGVSLAGGMIILIVGVPLFLLVLAVVRGVSLLEGRLVEALLGTRMPRRERADLPEAGWLKRVSFWLRDSRTWASMAYMVLMLPLGTAYFTIAVAGLATGVGLIGSPFGNWVNDHVFTWHGTEYVFSIPPWASPLAVIGGLALVLLWLHVIRWIGRGHAAFAKRMLVRLAH